MAIVTESYYTNVFWGITVATDDFPQFETWAERAVNAATRGRVTEERFLTFPAWMQEACRNAICAQIGYYAVYGLDSAITGISGASFTVGKVSVSQGNAFPTGRTSMICPQAMTYLEQTGLLNPQVDVCGEPFLPFWADGGWR